jgi:hypothetical protein
MLKAKRLALSQNFLCAQKGSAFAVGVLFISISLMTHYAENRFGAHLLHLFAGFA